MRLPPELFTYESKYMLSAQVSTSAIILEGDMVVAEMGSGGGRGHVCVESGRF
jgi:hypothetical protein